MANFVDGLIFVLLGGPARVLCGSSHTHIPTSGGLCPSNPPLLGVLEGVECLKRIIDEARGLVDRGVEASRRRGVEAAVEASLTPDTHWITCPPLCSVEAIEAGVEAGVEASIEAQRRGSVEARRGVEARAQGTAWTGGAHTTHSTHIEP